MQHHFIFLFSLLLVFSSCGGSNEKKPASKAKAAPKENVEKNNGKGVGAIKNVKLNNPLVHDMVQRGQSIYDMKCAACHKTTGTRVVGPGFAKVTERRKPEWIMNMVTNVEVMLLEDPVARGLLKECLVMMPNQNLSVGDARDVLEWMYANDGHEVATN